MDKLDIADSGFHVMSLSPCGPNLKEAAPDCQAKPAWAAPSDDQPAPPPQENGAPNLTRRIKKRAWAPEWNWFAVCAPGLEDILYSELAHIGMQPAPSQAGSGGVGFSGKLAAGYKANLWLRSAGRLLLRLADFRVRNWDDLVRQAARIAWEVFMPPGAPLNIRVTLKGSNLKHSGRVAEEVFKAVSQSLSNIGLAPPRLAGTEESGQTILVRGMDRRCQISLDSSGEHLHKRGYRLEAGKAPLREDLAAALLMLAGYDGRELLLDPMCGAGTLPIEAALMARRMPALGKRALAMQDWLCHRETTWQYLLNEAQKQTLEAAPAPILGRDLSPDVLKASRDNAARAGVSEDVRFDKADFFAADPPPGPAGLLVVNPPYGKRLGSVRQAGKFMDDLGRHLTQTYGGWRVAVVLYLPQWLDLLGLQEVRTLSAPFGGIKVALAAGKVPR